MELQLVLNQPKSTADHIVEVGRADVEFMAAREISEIVDNSPAA